MPEFKCDIEEPMVSGTGFNVPDGALTATSQFDRWNAPKYARITSSAWCPAEGDYNPSPITPTFYIQASQCRFKHMTLNNVSCKIIARVILENHTTLFRKNDLHSIN